MIKQSIIGLSMLLGLTSPVSFAESKELDHVTVIVNDSVILESEVQAIIREVKRSASTSDQSLPSDRALRAQAIDRLILNSIQLQMGLRMGIQISDAQLESAIEHMAKNQNMTVEQLRQSVIQDGLSYEQYREKLREEIVINEVRRGNVYRRVQAILAIR